MLRHSVARSITGLAARSSRPAFAAAQRSLSTDADYDLVVIGGGPGGYVAAIKAAQLGLKVIDPGSRFGPRLALAALSVRAVARRGAVSVSRVLWLITRRQCPTNISHFSLPSLPRNSVVARTVRPHAWRSEASSAGHA